MNFMDKIKDINDWVGRTFTSAYVERSIDEESHTRRWAIHHADYMVIISYNYIFDYVNGIVSIRHKDPSTGQFMTEEYEGVTVNQFKEFVINYLEENKDKVLPESDDDETLISHIDFRKNSESNYIDDESKDHISKIDEYIDRYFSKFEVDKTLNVCADGPLMIWEIFCPYVGFVIGYMTNTHMVHFHIIINSLGYKGHNINDEFIGVPFNESLDRITKILLAYKDDIQEAKRYMESVVEDEEVESDFDPIDFVNSIVGDN